MGAFEVVQFAVAPLANGYKTAALLPRFTLTDDEVLVVGPTEFGARVAAALLARRPVRPQFDDGDCSGAH